MNDSNRDILRRLIGPVFVVAPEVERYCAMVTRCTELSPTLRLINSPAVQRQIAFGERDPMLHYFSRS